jgi:hypothetical protein
MYLFSILISSPLLEVSIAQKKPTDYAMLNKYGGAMLITGNPTKTAHILLSIAWIPFFVLLVSLWAINLEPEYLSRYGSVMVLCAVVAEFNLHTFKVRVLDMKVARLEAEIDPNRSIEFSEDAKRDLEARHDHTGELSAHLNVTIVLGTIIWGYGDIIAKWVYEAVKFS